MHVLIGFLSINQHPTKILQGTTIAIMSSIFPRYQEISQMKIFL